MLNMVALTRMITGAALSELAYTDEQYSPANTDSDIIRGCQGRISCHFLPAQYPKIALFMQWKPYHIKGCHWPLRWWASQEGHSSCIGQVIHGHHAPSAEDKSSRCSPALIQYPSYVLCTHVGCRLDGRQHGHGQLLNVYSVWTIICMGNYSPLWFSSLPNAAGSNCTNIAGWHFSSNSVWGCCDCQMPLVHLSQCWLFSLCSILFCIVSSRNENQTSLSGRGSPNMVAQTNQFPSVQISLPHCFCSMVLLK